MDYVFGRPKKHDRKKIAEELLEWSTNPTSFNLLQFTRPRMINATCFPDWAAIDPDFSESLQLAKQALAMNRFEAMLEGALPYADYAKSEHNYDPLFKRDMRKEKIWNKKLDLKMKKAELDHAHKLKKAEDGAADPSEFDKKLNEALNQLKSLSRSNANIDCNSTNKDTKS